jgi:haloalkane dehalogenase
MEWGAGRPVLMLHGNPTWGFLYRKVVAALAGDRCRLVLPDLAGLGLSDKPRDPAFHSIESHALAIGALVEGLGLDGLVAVVQDWGGPIGLHAFAGRAGALRGLVLLNTVVGPPRPGFRPTLFHRLPLISDFVFRRCAFPQAYLRFAQGDRGSIRGDVARAYRYPLRGHADNLAPLALARMVPDRPDHPSIRALSRCQEFVTAFDGPLEIVWGDRDPILGGVRRHLGRLLPRARVTATSAGHFVQEEVPAEIAAAVRRTASEIP